MNAGLKKLAASILRAHAARIVRNRGQTINLGDFVEAGVARELIDALGDDTPSGNVPEEVRQLEVQLGLTVQTRTASLALAKVLELEAAHTLRHESETPGQRCPEALRRLIFEAVGEASTLMAGDLPANPNAAVDIANRICDAVASLTIPRNA